MTVDERLDSRLYSTESLHATTALHFEQIEKLTANQGSPNHKLREIAATMSEIAFAVLRQEKRSGKLDGAADEV